MAKFTGRIGQRELVSYVDPHSGKKGSDFVAGTCSRCGGYGFISSFAHVYMGRCFKCGGNGAQNITVATVRKHARADAYERDYAPELAAHDDLQRWLHAEEFRLVDSWLEAEARFKEEERLAKMVQGFLGEIGDKISEIDITIKVAKYIAGSYNRSSSMFVIAETGEGQVIKFFGSAQSVMNLERSDAATITTGRVKEHAEWNGQQQSVLSHVKVEIHEELDQEEDIAA